ncbi:MAG: phage tail protein [Clostridia bacterium]|jgi:phage tail P2-like protein|nr:phage tail protein [Clostridia bacterium]
MAMDLKNISLLSLQTKCMQQDPTTVALCSAFEPQFRQLTDEVKACLIYASVDTMDDKLLDELAWSMHVDWYDAKAETEIKRLIIKRSLKVHRYRGTLYAIEETMKDYFQDAEVREWFEDGSVPYTFKVIARNQSVTAENEERFTMAVNAVKNVRSHMSELIMGLFCSDAIYCSDTLIII